MSGSRVERAGGGPPGDAPRPLRRPEGQGVTDGRPSPVALRRAASDRRGALLEPAHSATWAQRKGSPKLVGRTGSPCCMPQATLNAVDRVILAKPARAAQHPAGAAPRGSALEPAPTSAAAAVGQARRDGAPAAAALPARPAASLKTLNNFARLTGLLSGRSTPKSCTTCCSSAPGSAPVDRARHVLFGHHKGAHDSTPMDQRCQPPFWWLGTNYPWCNSCNGHVTVM